MIDLGPEHAAVDRLLIELEHYDGTTSIHVRTVGNWCRRIAQTLGLAGSDVRYIEMCGTLHDVGKLFTPIDILTKPGALTGPEWDRMRAHAAEGADLLEEIPALRDYAHVVRAHHERMDGRGYPNRLRAVEIPFEAKIVAIADAFDAMIASRPYRPAFSASEAIAELYRSSGAQFDVDLVDTFASILQPVRRLVAANVSYG